jgi:hypothetical protein
MSKHLLTISGFFANPRVDVLVTKGMGSNLYNLAFSLPPTQRAKGAGDPKRYSAAEHFCRNWCPPTLLVALPHRSLRQRPSNAAAAVTTRSRDLLVA